MAEINKTNGQNRSITGYRPRRTSTFIWDSLNTKYLNLLWTSWTLLNYICITVGRDTQRRGFKKTHWKYSFRRRPPKQVGIDASVRRRVKHSTKSIHKSQWRTSGVYILRRTDQTLKINVFAPKHFWDGCFFDGETNVVVAREFNIMFEMDSFNWRWSVSVVRALLYIFTHIAP